MTASDAREVRAWDAEITRMLRDGQLRSRGEADLLLEGRSHERLDQFYRGVRVFGGELVRQAERRADACRCSAPSTPGIHVDTEPTLSPQDAADIVAELTGAAVGPERAPELVVLPLDEGGFALAYRARVMTADDLTVFFIDAGTGDVVLRYSDLQTTVGTGQGVLGDTKKVSTTARDGTYLAQDAHAPAGHLHLRHEGQPRADELILNGLITLDDSDLATDSDNDWTDPAAVDAHVYAGWTYDYWYTRFNRQGLDNRNLTMPSFVHPVKREDWASQPASVLNLYYLNAFYAGDGIMVYGEGLPPDVTMGGTQWNYFSGALDVVAHELAHGITDYTSGLIYRNESGALNEAFSDIIGTGVEFYYQPAGSGYMKADYLLGEDLDDAARRVPVDGESPGLRRSRSLLEALHRDVGQRRRAQQLRHRQPRVLPRHRGRREPHVGAGGARASAPPTARRSRRSSTGRFTQMLPSNATFSMARAATLQAARDLYGAGSDVERAIDQAWTAVGVN